MPNRRHRLRLLPASRHDSPAAHCRAVGCELPRQGELGFCSACEAVYHAAHELRERLLEARAARIAAAHPHLFAALTPGHRQALLAHLAAHAHEARASEPGGLAMAGLEDFLRELIDSGDAT